MAVSPPPAPSSIDLSGLPPRVVEAAARVLALCREELRSEPRPEAPEEVELRVREATNEFARDVMGAVIENRDDGASRDRAGRAELVPGRGDAEDDHDLARSGDLPASALPQRRERGIAGAGRRELGPRRRLPDAAGGRARSADDGSLHGPGSGGVLCEDRRHDAVGEHPAAPDPEHARMLGEPRPGDAGQHP